MAAKQSWVWVDVAVVHAIHEEQLAEHGGAASVRDAGMLESALAQPLNAATYGCDADAASLAAEYAFVLARNHPFIDGNKRTAFVVCELFLMLNGQRLTASDAECVMAMLALAAGDTPIEAFAQWLRDHTAARSPAP